MGAPVFKLIHGEKGRHGALHTKRMIIHCTRCGNESRFYGTAYTNPMIVIDRQSHDQYDVVEMSYKSDGAIDEIVERCAQCGAHRDELTFTNIEDADN